MHWFLQLTLLCGWFVDLHWLQTCCFQSDILFHNFKDQKSLNEIPWIHNDCSSRAEAERTLACCCHQTPQAHTIPQSCVLHAWFSLHGRLWGRKRHDKPLAIHRTAGSPAVSSMAISIKSPWECRDSAGAWRWCLELFGSGPARPTRAQMW